MKSEFERKATFGWNESFDWSDDTSTSGFISPDDGGASGTLFRATDDDWIHLTGLSFFGTTYQIDILGLHSGAGTLEDPVLEGLYNSSGNLVPGTYNDDNGSTLESRLVISGSTAYSYIAVAAYDVDYGDYRVIVTSLDMAADMAADSISTAASVVPNNSYNGRIDDHGDADWVAIDLNEGQEIQVTVEGAALSAFTLSDPEINGIYDSSGQLIANTYDDDGGDYLGSLISFTPASQGTYYISVGGAGDAVGTYQLGIASGNPGSDAVSADTSTSASSSPGLPYSGIIDSEGDIDWIAVTLDQAGIYSISLRGAASASGTLDKPSILGVYDGNGVRISGTGSSDPGVTADAEVLFSASSAGTWYVSAAEFWSDTGTYELHVTAMPAIVDDIGDNITSLANITVGGTFDSSIDYSGDRDWISIILQSDHVYQIQLALDASNGAGLSDPAIWGIYDSDGQFLSGSSNDDVLNGDFSAINFAPEVNGTYYISAGGYDGAFGDFQLTSSDVTAESQAAVDTQTTPFSPFDPDLVPVPDNVNVAAILSGGRFAQDPNSVVTTVTFSFPGVGSTWDTDPITGYDSPATSNEPWVGLQGLSDSEQDLFRGMIEQVEDLTNLDFVEVTESSSSAGEIRISWTSSTVAEGAAAWAYYPTGSAYSSDIWLASLLPSNTAVGSYFHVTLIHELGHALGLKHPFETAWLFPVLASELDSENWTVMSYQMNTDYVGAVDADLHPQTYMYLDIVALQHFYGLDWNSSSGNNEYLFDGADRHFLTIWDTDGIDTLRIANLNVGVNIDLTPGTWQDVGTMVEYYSDYEHLTVVGQMNNTVYIPPEVLIENAIGGVGPDSLSGNDLFNSLFGGDGNDMIVGRAGNDSLYGQSGRDTIHGGDDDDMLEGGSDKDVLYGDDGADALNGGSGSDTLYGGPGNDIITANRGEDLLVGGSGADVLSGNGGRDTLSYEGDTTGVIVDLLVGVGFGGDAEGDTFSSINDLVGGDGSDILSASGSANLVEGGGGNDTIYLRRGADEGHGGAGDDTIDGSAGIDTIYGDSDNDTLSGGSAADSLYGGAGNDYLNGGVGGDYLKGDGGNDTIEGKTGNDRIIGNAGNDILYGQGNNDELFGGGGMDLLEGGSGDDQLYGGSAADIFSYTAPAWGSDTIHDFEDGVDLIDMVDTGLSFSDLTIATDGPDTLVTAPDGSAILLLGIGSGIEESDFVFGG